MRIWIHKSLKRKVGLILFLYDLMIRWENAFERKQTENQIEI